mgnify:CR=1 FL=1
MLAKRLDIDYFDNDLLRLASEESGINISLFGKADEKVSLAGFQRIVFNSGYFTVPCSCAGNIFDYF